MRAWMSLSILVAALFAWNAPAQACSFASREMSPAQIREYARNQFAGAALIVDAEVEVPMDFELSGGQLPMALLRVLKTYKGVVPSGDRIALVYRSSCDLALTRKGERVRILLIEGPTLFRAVASAHAPPAQAPDAQTQFNAEIDALAGSRRPNDYSAFPGAEEPPELP